VSVAVAQSTDLAEVPNQRAVCVCVYVYVCVCVYVCAYVCVNECMYVCVVRMYVCYV